MRRAKLLLTVFVALLLATAVMASASEVRVAISVYPWNMISMNVESHGASAVIENIYNGLVEYDPDTLQPKLMLAEGYEISSDVKTYTFYLRKGVQFHQGYGELTAEDVEYTIMANLDPEWKSNYKQGFEIVDFVEVVDKYTVKIHLKRPSVAFLDTLLWHSGYIISKKAAEELGPQNYNTNPIGTDSFFVADRIPGQEVVLEAFEDHFRGRPKLDRLVYVVIPESTVALNAVATGEVHVAGIQQPSGYRLAEKLDNVELVPSRAAQQCYILVHQARFPTNDLRVRLAIAHAINWDEIIQAFGGLIEKNNSLYPTFMLGHTTTESQYEYDMERAAELMASTGLDRPTLKIISTTGEIYPELAQILKQQLSPLFDVEIMLAERGEWWDGELNWDWNLDPGLWTRFDPAQFIGTIFPCGAVWDIAGYCSEWLDEQVLAAETELDPDRREALYRMIEYRVTADVAMFNAGTVASIIAVNAAVKGAKSLPYTLCIDFQDVTVEE